MVASVVPIALFVALGIVLVFAAAGLLAYYAASRRLAREGGAGRVT